MTELHLNDPSTSVEAAAEVLDGYWENANPKPIASYYKIRGIVRRCMDAEYRADEIIQALHNTDTFTLPAIEFALRSARKKAVPSVNRRIWKPDTTTVPLPADQALKQIRMIRNNDG